MWMLRLPDNRTVLCPAKRHSGHCPFDDKTAYINVSCLGRRWFGYCPYGNNAPCMDVAGPPCPDRRSPRPPYGLSVTNLLSMLVLSMLTMRQHSRGWEQCVPMENVRGRGCRRLGCNWEQCVPMENVQRRAVCLQ